MKTIMRMLVIVCIMVLSVPVLADAAGSGMQTHSQTQDQTKDQTLDKLQDQDQLHDQSCLLAQQESAILSGCERDCTHDQLRLRDRLQISDAVKLQIRDRIRLQEQLNS